ncbi:MAG: hypothetical protein HYW25_00900 [Candidatus Aenigmarchaeota archaeon]|nr:hypothetical protein [Candidatus Aenigmarchaeota archaeon]
MDDYGNLSVVFAVIMSVIILIIAVPVFLRASSAGLNETRTDVELPEAGLIEMKGRDSKVTYTMNENNIKYRVDADLQLKSERNEQIIFVIRFKGMEIAAPCISAGGFAEIPCSLPSDGSAHDFRITADFEGSYSSIPPIINLSAYSSTSEWPKAAGTQGVLNFEPEGQQFIVGHYSAFVVERALAEIETRVIDVPTGLAKYKVTVKCVNDFSKIIKMDIGEKQRVPFYCNGEISVEIPGENKIRIATRNGDEWHGTGEKIDVYAWRVFDGFDCGGFTDAYSPFSVSAALRDEQCLNHFIDTEIIQSPLGDGYDSNLDLLPLVG